MGGAHAAHHNNTTERQATRQASSSPPPRSVFVFFCYPFIPWLALLVYCVVLGSSCPSQSINRSHRFNPGACRSPAAAIDTFHSQSCDVGVVCESGRSSRPFVCFRPYVGFVGWALSTSHPMPFSSYIIPLNASKRSQRTAASLSFPQNTINARPRPLKSSNQIPSVPPPFPSRYTLKPSSKSSTLTTPRPCGSRARRARSQCGGSPRRIPCTGFGASSVIVCVHGFWGIYKERSGWIYVKGGEGLVR